MKDAFLFGDQYESFEAVELTGQEVRWVELLLQSDLSHSEIWCGSIKGTNVRRKDRDALKARIKADMLDRQHNYCAYCRYSFTYSLGENKIINVFDEEEGVVKHGVHREHLAPKAQYRKFTFETRNLVLACFKCNSEYKKTYNTVVLDNDDYARVEFSIVHPILDKFSDHLVLDKTGVLKERNGCEKGKKTIRLFGLDESSQVGLRSAYLRAARENLEENDEQMIIRTSSKPRVREFE